MDVMARLQRLPGASPPALHVSCVQHGKKATSTARLCSVHNLEGDGAAQAAIVIGMHVMMMCSAGWLRGRLLEADGQTWEASWE